MTDLPARSRVATRLRQQCASAVAGSGRTVTEAGAVADRWHTGFTDLSGPQGLVGQVEGRRAGDVADWLAQRDEAWRAAVRTVSIDMCPAFRAAVRQALPRAILCVDAFHLVQFAYKMVTRVRWRIVRSKYGRRGRKTDPEYGIKRLLMRNHEDLSPARFAKLWNTIADDAASTDVHLAWIATEHLRDLLALRITRSHTTPAASIVRDRYTSLVTWCADHAHVPEIAAFARTLDTWRDEIVNAVLTTTKSENPDSDTILRHARIHVYIGRYPLEPRECAFRSRCSAAQRVTVPSRQTRAALAYWIRHRTGGID